MTEKQVTTQAISEFISYLRYKKRIQVLEIVEDTGLSRQSINDLENQKRKSVSNKTISVLRSVYKDVFDDFINNYQNTPSEQEVITATKKEFEDLKATVAKMAEELINLSQDKRALIEENKNLRDEINRLKK